MIYLASKSTRRAELLRQISVPFETMSIEIDESHQVQEPVADYVIRMALSKARAAVSTIPALGDTDFVLAADTTISVDSSVIGKPKNAQDCERIIKRLSGRQHQVLSAVVLMNRNNVYQKLSTNSVSFRAIDESEIALYCAFDEPLDKAGSYAIQGKAAIFIEHLEGSYSAVMGLPLFETAELFKKVNIPVLKTCQ